MKWKIFEIKNYIHNIIIIIIFKILLLHFRLSNLFCFLPLQKIPSYHGVPKNQIQKIIKLFSQLHPLLKELGFSMYNPKLTRG
jgi:hypothetical protein